MPKKQTAIHAKHADIPVVIFCGGKGTRLREETESIPKPLVRIGNMPILWHIMKIYSAYGFRRFILPVGYKGEKIKEFFLNYHALHADFTVSLDGNGTTLTTHTKAHEPWEVTIVDTGDDAETGSRLLHVKPYLKNDLFMLTYGDGVGDIDISALLSFHVSHKKLATVTGVLPPARFGILVTEGDLAVQFREKDQSDAGRINGGFFVLQKGIFSYFSKHRNLNFEHDVLPKVAKDRKLAMYRHDGYWQCMDTRRDMEYLSKEWETGKAGWKVWSA